MLQLSLLYEDSFSKLSEAEGCRCYYSNRKKQIIISAWQIPYNFPLMQATPENISLAFSGGKILSMPLCVHAIQIRWKGLGPLMHSTILAKCTENKTIFWLWYVYKYVGLPFLVNLKSTEFWVIPQISSTNNTSVSGLSSSVIFLMKDHLSRKGRQVGSTY